MFKKSTILFAFRETRLYPFKPAKVLEKLQAQEEEEAWGDGC